MSLTTASGAAGLLGYATALRNGVAGDQVFALVAGSPGVFRPTVDG